MSDFLGRLARRSMGIEAAVQPVIPASTAPAGPSPGLLEQEEFTDVVERRASQEPVKAAYPGRNSRREEMESETAAEPPASKGNVASREALPSMERAWHENRWHAKAENFQGSSNGDDAARTLPAWNSSRSEAASIVPPPAAVRQAEARRETAATAAPIVRVTIGRVEVRANLSAAPAQPASFSRAKSAAVALDEYLKQRAEGRR